MLNFIITSIIWVLAIYGLIEIIKTILYTYFKTDINKEGLYIVLALKNQENNVEGFFRTFINNIIYEKEFERKNIILVDLDSDDNTKELIQKINTEYGLEIKTIEELKEILNEIK